MKKTYKFCPLCANKLTKKLKSNKIRLICDKCGFIHYQNPAPAVGVFIIEKQKVLLAKRKIKPYLGWWDSIGGFIEAGESPQETAIRETKEETGLKIKLLKFLGATNDKYDTIDIVPMAYIGKIISGKPKPADDVSKLKWFHLQKLPKRIAFKANRKTLSFLKNKILK